MKSEALNFDRLVETLAQAHGALEAQAAKAVNVSLTLRNWLFGYHIREYEQSGADRSAYGERLLETLAQRLQQTGLKRIEARELRRYRQFYLAYPQIRETLSAKLPGLPIRETPSPESGPPAVPLLLERLSFSHFAELLQLDDATQRAFYEAEALRGHWSVRELKRQMATRYYQRSGLSLNQAALSALAQSQAEAATPQQVIRDPYVFEFLGLKPQEVVTEGQLEDALLDAGTAPTPQLLDRLETAAEQRAFELAGEQIGTLIARLDIRQRVVWERLMGVGPTLDECAQQLGVSRVAVHRQETRLRRRLRKKGLRRRQG